MTVVKACHTASPKNHLILSERSCLIRKEVLNLSKVLGDIQGSALNSRIHFLIVEIHITLNKIYLSKLHNFNGNIERNGNQDLKRTTQFKKCYRRKKKVEKLNIAGEVAKILKLKDELDRNYLQQNDHGPKHIEPCQQRCDDLSIRLGEVKEGHVFIYTQPDSMTFQKIHRYQMDATYMLRKYRTFISKKREMRAFILVEPLFVLGNKFKVKFYTFSCLSVSI